MRADLRKQKRRKSKTRKWKRILISILFGIVLFGVILFAAFGILRAAGKKNLQRKAGAAIPDLASVMAGMELTEKESNTRTKYILIMKRLSLFYLWELIKTAK